MGLDWFGSLSLAVKEAGDRSHALNFSMRGNTFVDSRATESQCSWKMGGLETASLGKVTERADPFPLSHTLRYPKIVPQMVDVFHDNSAHPVGSRPPSMVR